MCTRRNSRPLDKTRQKLGTDAQAGTKRDKKGYKGIIPCVKCTMGTQKTDKRQTKHRHRHSVGVFYCHADVVELADTRASEARGLTAVRVRASPSAPDNRREVNRERLILYRPEPKDKRQLFSVMRWRC